MFAWIVNNIVFAFCMLFFEFPLKTVDSVWFLFCMPSQVYEVGNHGAVQWTLLSGLAVARPHGGWEPIGRRL